MILVSTLLTPAQTILAAPNCAELFTRNESDFHSIKIGSEAVFSTAKMMLMDVDLKLFGVRTIGMNESALRFFDYKAFESSFVTPQNSGSPALGVQAVFYHGDLFPDFWFAIRGQQSAFHQPWFELDHDKEVYKYHSSGAEERILSHFIGDGESVVLYRGTGPGEGDVFQILQKLRASGLNAEERLAVAERIKNILSTNAYVQRSKDVSSAFQSLANRLKTRSSYRRALNHLIRSYSNFRTSTPPANQSMIFMTPDLEQAKRWAKPFIMKIEIPRELFVRFAADASLYAGIEFGQLEIAMASREAITFYSENAEVIQL